MWCTAEWPTWAASRSNIPRPAGASSLFAAGASCVRHHRARPQGGRIFLYSHWNTINTHLARLPHCLPQVQVVYDTTALDPKVAEYSKMRGALTDLVDDLISRKRRGKKIKEPMVGAFLEYLLKLK